jgi:hypothetical protein
MKMGSIDQLVPAANLYIGTCCIWKTRGGGMKQERRRMLRPDSRKKININHAHVIDEPALLKLQLLLLDDDLK